MSQSSLAISLFFHLSATVVWIGGLVILSILVIPETRRLLQESPALYSLLSRWRRRFFPLSNLSLVVLVITGLLQMSANENYDGLMQFDNDWSRVILLKHIAIIGMVIAGLVLQYGVAPALERATLLIERGKGDAEAIASLRKREARLTWVNVALGMMVLACSAWAGSL